MVLCLFGINLAHVILAPHVDFKALISVVAISCEWRLNEVQKDATQNL